MPRLLPWLPALASALVLNSAGSVFASPITISFESRVSHLSLPFTTACCPVAIGDSVAITVTYESTAALTGPGSGSDTYSNAILGISAAFSTGGGSVRYTADSTVSPNTVNFALVTSGDAFFYIADYDFDGSNPPVTGPGFSEFVPWFLALEIGGDFSSSLAANTLPSMPLVGASYTRLTVGFYPAGAYEAFAPVPAPVPEPSSLLLLGSGLACGAAWRRRRCWPS